MKRVLLKLAFCVAMAAMCMGCGHRMQEYSAVDTAMGTIVQQRIYTTQEDCTGDILALITDLENSSLSRRVETSEIGKLNRAAGDSYVVVSTFLADTLTKLKTLYADSDGALDVSIGALIELWDIDARAGSTLYTLPEKTEIERALSLSGFDRVEIKGDAVKLPEGMILDPGAIGKGMACDVVREYLEENSVQAAVISVGGSVLTYGEKPDGSAFKVGIVNPFATDENIGFLTLTGSVCVSTSGDYERYVEADGVRYHHIMDPRTGYPAESGIKSVTVVSESGFLSDALSTACFVMGEERGIELVNQYGAEALLIRDDGSFAMTEGMEQLFTAQ